MRNKRKKQVNAPVGSDTFERRMERQRARRKMDREGKDANGNGKADKREGKDVSHTVLQQRIALLTVAGTIRTKAVESLSKELPIGMG